MGEFFGGRKRKVGVLTLALACLFAAGWVRSSFQSDCLNIHFNRHMHCHLMSFRQMLYAACFFTELPRYESHFYWGNGLEYTDQSPGFDGDRSLCLCAPYWSIVLPLTALSALLLLSKPRHSTKTETFEPFPGFDLMGKQSVSADTGADVFAIRELDVRAWELKTDRWSKETLKKKLEDLIDDSRPVNGLLVHLDTASDRDDPTATAPLLVITAEGTVAIISIGIEVHDDSEKPGTFFSGESDLNPKANAKGRRYSVRYLHEVE